MSALKGILCTVFKGSRRQELYLYVDKKEQLTRVPQEALDSLGTLSEVMTLHLTPEKKLARVDAQKVLDEIIAKGFYIQMPPALYPEAQS